jgi:hypothetical protein
MTTALMSRKVIMQNMLGLPMAAVDAAFEEVSTLDQARTYVLRHSNSYSRMGNVLKMGRFGWMGCGPLKYKEWLTLLGEEWTCCDNIRDYLPFLRKVLGTNGPLRQMMTLEENEWYDALPDSIICYRGCDQSVLKGASWTLDKEIANSFPFTNRYRSASPVVVTARVKKERILAVKLDREEKEIITFSARPITVEPADEERAASYHASNL